jgi:hypothetical protein
LSAKKELQVSINMESSSTFLDMWVFLIFEYHIKVLKLALVFNHHLHQYYSSTLSAILLFYESTKALVIFFFSYVLINIYC